MDINKLLSQIIGNKVISCEIGENIDSIYCIDFEKNVSLILFSAWRLEYNECVIVSDQDAVQMGKSRIWEYIQEIKGKKLLSFSISMQYDLVLNFEDFYRIKTFSNISYFQTENGGDWDANWKLGFFDENIIGCATNHFDIKFEKFDETSTVSEY